MSKASLLKSQSYFLHSSPFINPIEKILINYRQCISFPSKSPNFHSWPLLSHQTHILKPIALARKKRRGSGSQRLMKILPKLVSIAASYLKILPEPLNLFIAEFTGNGGGGDGGDEGSWFWKGFDGWRRKGKKINLVVILGLLVFCELGSVLFRKELKIEALYGVLALGLILTNMRKGFKRGIKDLVLEFCLAGALIGLKLKKEEKQRWLQKVRVWPPICKLAKGKRKTNGARFL